MTVDVGDLPGIPVDLIEPGTPEWLACISASKVAAILGLSPYDSRFSLFHRMRGNVPAEPDDDIKRRGHYLEPAIRAWFADQHPDWTVQTTGSWRHPDRPWQTASPDGLVLTPDGVACLEVKSDDNQAEWGTGEIPPRVRAQTQWQMDTTGARRTYVAMIGPYLEFREYVVDYDPDDAAFIRERCIEFRAQLAAGTSPPIDGHTETYVALRQLHPDIEDVKAEIPMELANDYRNACAALDAAKAEKQLQTALIADAMGNARRAVDPMGDQVAIRIAKNGGTPYVQAAQTRSTL